MDKNDLRLSLADELRDWGNDADASDPLTRGFRSLMYRAAAALEAKDEALRGVISESQIDADELDLALEALSNIGMEARAALHAGEGAPQG